MSASKLQYRRNEACREFFGLTWVELQTLVALVALERVSPGAWARPDEIQAVVESAGDETTANRNAFTVLKRRGLIEQDRPYGWTTKFRARHRAEAFLRESVAA
jgi:hypothetical protein